MPKLVVDALKLAHNANDSQNHRQGPRHRPSRSGRQSVCRSKQIRASGHRLRVLPRSPTVASKISPNSKLSLRRKVLLRIGAISEASRIVRYADISLQSEVATITAIDKAARMQNKIHAIVLMFDLGDLREGIFFDSDYLPVVRQILQLKHVRLLGIGTNLTCYGGVVPSVENMRRLVQIAESIENAFHIRLEIISGGNSSIFPLLIARSCAATNQSSAHRRSALFRPRNSVWQCHRRACTTTSF
ncbi:MAG: alanine racemase [Bacillus subtilis]|nr:alanine racemase [Bacillus subtilis]